MKKQIANKVIALVNKEDITLTSVLSDQGRGGNAVINDYQKFALLKLKDKIINLFGTMRLRGEI